MQASDRSLSCAETAKLVRRALREAFPGVTFSVRSKSYAGGSSISVGWTDGPTERDVREVTHRFRGADFDSMQDMKVYRGSTLLANDDGSYETIRYGADYIQGQRTISEARRALLRREIERFTGRPFAHGERFAASVHDGQLSRDEHVGSWGSDILLRLAHDRTWKGEPCPGGDGSYCPGCGRWQGEHRAPHLH